MKRIGVVYIHGSQLSPRWLRYYYLDEISCDFSISYWDCSRLADPSFLTPVEISRPYVIKIHTVSQLVENLKNIPKDTLIVNDLHFSKGNFRLHKIISSYFPLRIYINFFSNNAFSLPSNSLKRRICSWFNYNVIMSRAYGFLTNKLYNSIIFSSENGNKDFVINHPDYEEYLKNKDKHNDRIISEDYILFLDNFFPLHPEIIKRNPKIEIGDITNDYYQSLNLFFYRLEILYNCKVVIAAHPSSNYKINPYGGRKILYNMTCNLVKYSKAVILHTSNSFAFASLYNKPFMLISNSAFRKVKSEYSRLLSFSENLKMNIFDIDNDDLSINSFCAPNNSLLDSYNNKYLIGVKDTSNVDLYVKYFREIYKRYY